MSKKRPPYFEPPAGDEARAETFWDDVEYTGNPRFSGTGFWGEYNRQELELTKHDDGLGAYREDKDENSDRQQRGIDRVHERRGEGSSRHRER